MSSQNPRTRLIAAVQALRHSPITGTSFQPMIPATQWMDLCEAYDDLLLAMQEEK